jgi:hypothetical protein
MDIGIVGKRFSVVTAYATSVCTKPYISVFIYIPFLHSIIGKAIPCGKVLHWYKKPADLISGGRI